MSKYKYDCGTLSDLAEAVLRQASINFDYNADGDFVTDEDGHGEIQSFRDARQGVCGFIYTDDCVRFYLANKRGIIDKLKEMIYEGCFETKNVIDAVSSYGCLKNYKEDSEDELIEAIGRVVYSSLTFDEVFEDENDLLTVVCEALAWGALEDTIFSLQDTRVEEVNEEDGEEVAND